MPNVTDALKYAYQIVNGRPQQPTYENEDQPIEGPPRGQSMTQQTVQTPSNFWDQVHSNVQQIAEHAGQQLEQAGLQFETFTHDAQIAIENFSGQVRQTVENVAEATAPYTRTAYGAVVSIYEQLPERAVVLNTISTGAANVLDFVGSGIHNVGQNIRPDTGPLPPLNRSEAIQESLNLNFKLFKKRVLHPLRLFGTMLVTIPYFLRWTHKVLLNNPNFDAATSSFITSNQLSPGFRKLFGKMSWAAQAWNDFKTFADNFSWKTTRYFLKGTGYMFFMGYAVTQILWHSRSITNSVYNGLSEQSNSNHAIHEWFLPRPMVRSFAESWVNPGVLDLTSGMYRIGKYRAENLSDIDHIRNQRARRRLYRPPENANQNGGPVVS